MADRAAYALISRTAKAMEKAAAQRLYAPLREALQQFADQVAAGHQAAAVIGAWASGWQNALDGVKEHWAPQFAAHGYALAGGLLGKRVHLAELERQGARFWGMKDAVLVAPSADEDGEDAGGDELVANHLRPRVASWIADTSKIETQTTARIFDRLYRLAMGTVGQDDSWTPAQLAAQILEAGLAEARSRAELMSRTMTNWSYNMGADVLYADSGIDLKEWMTTEDDAACPWCRPLDGRKAKTGGGLYFKAGETIESDEGEDRELDLDVAHAPLHPQCLVGETPILAPDKISAFVAAYSGPVIEIATTDGRRLTVTPNHMFLTPQGFACAKSLRKGDQIFSSAAFERIVGSDPDDNRKPPTIREVVEALSETRGVTAARVPVTAKDLHGDGRFCDGDVDVITTDRFLSYGAKPALAQSVHEPQFSGADAELLGLPGCRDLAAVLFALRDAADGGMGLRRESAAFSCRQPIHPDLVGFAAAPDDNAGSQEPVADDVARRANALRQGEFGFAGGITTAEILSVNVSQFSGHVYDLQSVSSLYVAGGLITSNCRCTIVPVIE